MVETTVLHRAVTLLDAAGFQVHFHAIGDGAVRQALDAVEEAIYENGNNGNRHHIAHLELIDPADILRFADLGVVANFQPAWAYADDYVTELTVPFIGDERARWLYPIKSVEDAGGVIAFGSDWSVSTANPLEQIETAITRKHIDDESIPVLFPEERISLASAIAAFTINGAFVNNQEQDTGSIEVGKYADLVVLDHNLFEIAPADISTVKVVTTILEGQVIYGDLGAL
jgi:predicted amidohydrolase YtcJ